MLFDRLAARFGRGQVVMGVDPIEPGRDFRRLIADAVESCQVLLALIGTEQAGNADEPGVWKLKDPDDFVRLEIEAAIRRGIRIFPVLTGKVRMPRAQELPATLTALASLPAHQLRPATLERDLDKLVRDLERA